MFRYILVPATGARTDDAVFRTAMAVARGTAGHLGFLHVRLDVQQVMIAMAGGDMGAGGGWGDLIDTVQTEVETRHQRAHAAVAAFCAEEQIAMRDSPIGDAPSAVLRVDTGDEAQMLASYGRTADLVVIGRARDDEPVALDVLEAVLLESGRPLLIAPERAPTQFGRRIVVAWKDTAEAARAVAAVLPLLAAAEAVTIVSVEEDLNSGAASRERLRHALTWHNSATGLRVVAPQGREPVDVLLSVVQELQADLLVMGGYSHSRMREVVFGGFTRQVLRAAGVPVLMAH